MKRNIKINKGLDIHLKGSAFNLHHKVAPSLNYTVYPTDYPGLIPEVVVKDGDKIQAGTTLLYDKNAPSLKVVSPVSGTVLLVDRCEQRVLKDILIEADGKESFIDFGKKDVNELSGKTIKTTLAAAGILALFRQRPYDRIVNPEETPRDIFVSGFYSAPLHPDFDYVLKGQETDFQTGLDALAKLTDGKVYLGVRSQQQTDNIQNAEVMEFEGPHPAGNVGVQINHICPVNKGEVVWTVRPEDVLVIGRFFNKGSVDMTRLVALCGSEVNQSALGYYTLRLGQTVEPIVENSVTQNIPLRFISGNPLTGKRISASGSLRVGDPQITVIPEGDECFDFLGWARLVPAKVVDARVKGSRRAMILSEEWDKVFPMDILPDFLIRAIVANDVKKMEELGIYEVAPEDFALCEFVDTSKMELQQIVRQGLDTLYKEMI
ncbi:MAG: Na(+)-translocating NADH-quinone reductase subunit A [Candidatus Symbiothrix sp.]|jgi:Na+-transporting NADH:ubiquinone oxidoreductase subunit A|nr:Na(+)-translocating NADH-quinone reductase subunit A [Candidatus Symbiothrix sp.]